MKNEPSFYFHAWCRVLFIDFVFLGVFGYHPVSSMIMAIYLRIHSFIYFPLSFFGLSCALSSRQHSLHPFLV